MGRIRLHGEFVKKVGGHYVRTARLSTFEPPFSSLGLT